MKVLTKEELFESNRSTSFQGYLNATFSELTTILGAPTFDPGDELDATNFEWCIMFCGNLFTVYDWKSTEEYSITERQLWHVGAEWRGNDLTPVGWFQSEINRHLAKLNNKNEYLASGLSKVKKIEL